MSKFRLAATAFSIALLATITPQVAHAAPPQDKRNCVINLSQHNKVTCYATFTEAIADGTDGKMVTAPSTYAKAIKDPATIAKIDATASFARDASVTGGTVIGMEWMDVGYTGGLWIVEAGWGCTWALDDTDFWIPNLWGTWVQDAITSYQAMGGCWVDHFTDADFHGIHTGYEPEIWFIGPPFNDKTSSIRWS
jgi:hypothetical protein